MVRPAEAIITALERNWDMVDRALEGLDDATLSRCPNDQCNSIAWTLWHMNRVWDILIYMRLLDQEPIWTRDGWWEKFGMSKDPEERGVGWTAQQVVAWQPPPQDILLGYYEAVKAATREYLDSLTPSDMECQVVIPPLTEPRSLAASIGQRTWDIIAHGGQIAYLRGMYQGMGWYPV